MKAITVVPGDPGQVRVEEVQDAKPAQGELLVEGLLLGLCGTDADIVEEGYGWVPPGQQRLLLGHESLGSVRDAPPGSGFAPGDLVAGIVRRPDPVPCEPCAHGSWDFCSNGRYTERGIKELDGYGSQLWRIEPEYAIKLDPRLGDCGVLLEPASVLAKAWEQIDRFVTRAPLRPRTVLVTGAGPIGLLAALMGAQRALEVHVLDVNGDEPKAQLVKDLGATFHVGSLDDAKVTPELIVDTTGHGPLVFDLTGKVAPSGVICLTGIASDSRRTPVPLDESNKEMVLENTVMFGSVNANRRNFEQAAEALADADLRWLRRLITRKVPLSGFTPEFLHKRPEDVKVVVDLQA
ncbi:MULTISPECIES: glucose 1-dehydrogenase [Streptomyces]|uniref:Zinc-binding dehydrogenase family oxidoreductase n=2 Tax=Streptomyces albus subsp. albus TaxID=67257 RepID=H6D562_STRA4|nr:glucose 1-dehydrogenase [Streptomyces sp. SCSIO ZS0520]AEZ53938.1 putative zinc-binding dehydrogenase family oxidoreductase [Streptomyces albus]CCD31883.1 putative Zn-dependent dehydrogenase [Streptomyces albus subsp. albus]AJE80663.1 zinc-binding dehydrogenase family oxidoreductase [Streptomyces albus]AOU74974.1 zinc-binding dehydrogenase family oxidoreductase [Streptomyces albus]AYN30783.1 theronine dehydrogenase [Streptomyces albus]